MPQRPKIGAQIRRARQLLDMRQQDLADAVGVSRTAVDRWENDHAYPQRKLAKLEHVLGIDLSGEPAAALESLDDLKVDGRWLNAAEEAVAADPDIPEALKRRMIIDSRGARSAGRHRRGQRGALATGAV